MDATFADERSTMNDTGSSLSTPMFAFLLAWPLVLIAAAGYYINSKLQQMEDEQALRPRIAILDIDAIVAASRGAGDSTAGVQKGLDLANVKLSQLREAGFLVIDKQFVRAAPDAVKVPSP